MKVFLEEAEEQIQLLDEEVIKLEKEATEDGLATIFRAAHTLKGSSAMIGYRAMSEVAHAMESMLDKLRNGAIVVTPEVVDSLLHSLDALRVLNEELVEAQGIEVDFESLVKEADAAVAAQLGESVETGPDKSEGPPKLDLGDSVLADVQSQIESNRIVFKVDASLDEESAFGAVRFFQLHSELAEFGKVITSNPSEAQIAAEEIGTYFTALIAADLSAEDIEKSLAEVQDISSLSVAPFDPSAEQPIVAQTGSGVAELVVPEVESPGSASPEAAQVKESSASEGQHKAAAQTVRIDVERLDHLMNLIGELVIDRTRIQQIERSLISKYQGDELVNSLGKTSSHIVKVVDDLQEDFMKVRMLPISTVFNAFPRMMRDLSRKLEKPIDFQIEGGETEIDRTVIERIRDPLVHMLRNALDHGLEDAASREAVGKSATGTVELSAYHEQGHIVIKVKDDGGGIDPEKLRNSFVGKGLISAEAARRLSDSEALDLIFMPGGSTKEQATELSGRGVGMDIVKKNVEAINGFVDLQSELGKGTTLSLRLPLTLATVNSILVRVTDVLCAIPLVYVLEAVKLHQDSISTVQGREVFRLRDRVIPLIDLAVATDLKRRDGEELDIETRHVVVVRIGERLSGVVVDSLLEPQEIVVKSLGKYVGDMKGVTGASILGDGRVVLILDVGGLISAVGRNDSPKSTDQDGAAIIGKAA